MIGLAVLVLIFVLIVVKWRKKQRAQAQAGEIKGEDLNPVYGIYYFSNGGRIDESQSVVADGNEYYGK